MLTAGRLMAPDYSASSPGGFSVRTLQPEEQSDATMSMRPSFLEETQRIEAMRPAFRGHKAEDVDSECPGLLLDKLVRSQRTLRLRLEKELSELNALPLAARSSTRACSSMSAPRRSTRRSTWRNRPTLLDLGAAAMSVALKRKANEGQAQELALCRPRCVGDVLHALSVVDWQSFQRGEHVGALEVIQREALLCASLAAARCLELGRPVPALPNKHSTTSLSKTRTSLASGLSPMSQSSQLSPASTAAGRSPARASAAAATAAATPGGRFAALAREFAAARRLKAELAARVSGRLSAENYLRRHVAAPARARQLHPPSSSHSHTGGGATSGLLGSSVLGQMGASRTQNAGASGAMTASKTSLGHSVGGAGTGGGGGGGGGRVGLHGATLEQRRNKINFWLEFHGLGPMGDIEARDNRWPSFLPERAEALKTSNSLPALKLPGRRFPPGSTQTPFGAKASMVPTTTATASPSGRRTPVNGRGGPAAQKLIAAKGRHCYLRACGEFGRLPLPIPLVFGNTANLRYVGGDATDGDILPLVDVISAKVPVEEVSFEGNSLLTDTSIVPLLGALKEYPHTATIRRVSLSGCTRLGPSGIDACIELFRQSGSLKYVNLSHLNIGSGVYQSLLQELMQQPYLYNLDLSNTRLGQAKGLPTCFDHLLGEDSVLSRLDISWNGFNGEGFQALGKALAANATLRTLLLSNSSAKRTGSLVPTNFEDPAPATNLERPSSDEGGGPDAEDPPIAYFFEPIWQNTTLTDLDVSVNRVDHAVALVIEDALDAHPRLKRICLDDNPLGALGLRCLLRLLASPRGALSALPTGGCAFGRDHPGPEVQIFSTTSPSRCYSIDLTRPTHRALMRMLYRLAERLKLKPDVAFEGLESSDPSFAHARKGPRGYWTKLPREGKLDFTFNLVAAADRIGRGLPRSDFQGFLRRFTSEARVEPPTKKCGPLLAKWHDFAQQQGDQLIFLNALSQDFTLPYACLTHLLSADGGLADQMAWRLVQTLNEGTSSWLVLALPSPGSYIKAEPKLRPFLSFQPEAPSGHYDLDLSCGCQRGVAERLVLINAWEVAKDKGATRPDVSQFGNWSRWRNILHDKIEVALPPPRPVDEEGEEIPLAPEEDAGGGCLRWPIPTSGQLEFDYVSAQRVTMGSPGISPETFSGLLERLQTSFATSYAKCSALRGACGRMQITSRQLRRLLVLFDGEERLQLAASFSSRVVDPQNSRIWMAVFLSEEGGWETIRKRLGFIETFPFYQPERWSFDMDFTVYEERLIATFLRGLATKEKPKSNLRNYSYIDGDGVVDRMKDGVPPAWANLAQVPIVGSFKCSYRCAIVDRNLEERHRLASLHLGSTTQPSESSLTPWALGVEVPEELLAFSEMLFEKFPGPRGAEAAFKVLDSKKRGFARFRDFEPFIKAQDFWRYREFTPEEEKSTFRGLFKTLDNKSSGELTENEWQVMVALWSEQDLALRLLINFLVQRFPGGIEEMWPVLAGSRRELSEEELGVAVRSLGFSGNCRAAILRVDGGETGGVDKAALQDLLQYHDVEEEEEENPENTEETC